MSRLLNHWIPGSAQSCSNPKTYVLYRFFLGMVTAMHFKSCAPNIGAVACLLLMVAGCGGSSNPQQSPDQAIDLVGKPNAEREVSVVFDDESSDWTWDLVAGRHYLVGTVSVSNDEDSLTVTYNTSGGWLMEELHLFAGEAPPVKKKPGQWPFKAELDPPADSYSFDVPLSAVTDEYKGKLFICAHADVVLGDQEEGAWGGYWNDGDPYWDFEWQNPWGGGFNMNVMPHPNLPEDWVSYRGYHFGTFSYWEIVFEADADAGFPPGSYNGPFGESWVGWCCDETHQMYANYPYNVHVMSSYDDDLPPVAQSENWDMINYLINARRSGEGIFNQNWTSNAMKTQFQLAVWYLVGGTGPHPGGLAGQFVDEAIANGDDYIPGDGEFYALILVPDTSSDNNTVRAQMNIIEVDP
jgi:hypothetical protein